MKYTSMNKAKGFTLVELMVVVAIVGIIVAVAIPSYQRSSLKAKRADGQTKLYEVQSNMERFIFDNPSYPDALSRMSAYTTDIVKSAEEHYDLSIRAATATCPLVSCYVIEAKALGGQAADGDLELHSNGTKVGNW